MYIYVFLCSYNTGTPCNKHLFPSLALEPQLLSITSGSSWLYVEWSNQSATFRVLYRESSAPDYQVIVPTTSQLSHNISALQPNTLYNLRIVTLWNTAHERTNSSTVSIQKCKTKSRWTTLFHLVAHLDNISTNFLILNTIFSEAFNLFGPSLTNRPPWSDSAWH